VEGFFCEIFCFMYQVLQKYPSVTCGDSSPKGEPMHKRESLNKNQPPLKGEPVLKRVPEYRRKHVFTPRRIH
ncbi:hypothetical protein, partial [Ruminococcus callidus]|uniref:hypothetical protein n=1 Tax=Ruminococcus callidus TaxID=40519 RepID=UPI003FD7DD7E